MSNYIYAIRTAFLLFPILAILITLPYIISQYRKYGSILVLRSAIIYSFILYLLVIYFLVILPLPPISEVQNYTNPYLQLEPLYSITYLKKSINFDILNFDTYWNLFGNSYFYQFIYNIFITIPFGIYLRYYFKCDFKKTFFYSFVLGGKSILLNYICYLSCVPESMMTISPRGSVAVKWAITSVSVPLTVCSCTLEISRHTATSRSAPKCSANWVSVFTSL